MSRTYKDAPEAVRLERLNPTELIEEHFCSSKETCTLDVPFKWKGKGRVANRCRRRLPGLRKVEGARVEFENEIPESEYWGRERARERAMLFAAARQSEVGEAVEDLGG